MSEKEGKTMTTSVGWINELTLCRLDDDCGSLLGDSVDGASDVEVGDLGEDTCINDAQASDTLDSETRVEDSVGIIERTNRH